jgi:flagellar biosynthesis protein FliP
MLLLCTCFTKVFMVLGITRNALGLTSLPPNQVLAGLALFISLFIMSPVVSQVNEVGVQPYLAGEKTQSQAFSDGVQPLRAFMLKSTREEELALLVKVSGQEKPANQDDVELTTLIPAFILVRAAGRVHHRLRHLHPVPADRHGGLRVPDVAGHDDAAPGDRLPAVQALLFVLVNGGG